MTENRLDRELDTRAKHTRKKAWAPPSLLPDPKPQDGWAYRWVRVATQGQDDPSNVSSKLREGWEPVKADECPEGVMFSASGKTEDNVIVGGLMLCKAPQEMVEQRKEYYRQMTESQMRSVNQNLQRENDARMPLFNESRSSVSFGKGK